MYQQNKMKYQKIVEILLYITDQITDVYTALKIIYFADRIHLSKYGRPVSNDVFKAMKHGPVPKFAYNIVDCARGDGLYPLDEDIGTLFDARDNRTILAKRPANLDYLSESDIECLDEAIATYGKSGFNELHDASSGPAYQSAGLNDDIPLEEIIKELPNGEQILDYMTN